MAMDLISTAEAQDIVLSAVARSAVQTLVKRLAKTTKKASEISAELVEARLRHQALEISRVKTLLATETAVPISQFYCPPRLTLGSRTLIPNSSRDFHYDRILIEGVAGQGKSILLRHLCSQAILHDGKIALFFELRQIDALKPLVQIILNSLRDLGLPGNLEALKSLAAQRDVEIYLDGYDEIDQKAASQIEGGLDYLAKNHPFIKVFVTSRPHVELSKSAALTVYRISELNYADAVRLIDKLSPEPVLAETLKQKLNDHPARAAELLETPLLVTLLVHRYARTQQIPEQLSEFYEDVFPLLFDRHDRFKVSFLRKRRLLINTPTYKKIFQKFCYFSLFAVRLDCSAAERIAIASKEPYAPQIDGNDFLADVSDISALLSEERGIWSFIHSSVQEYYAASYLLTLADSVLESSAATLERIPNRSSRDQVRRFARENDPYRSARFLELPFLRAMCAPLSLGALSDEDVLAWLRVNSSSITFDKNIVDGGKFFSIATKWNFEVPIRLFVSTQYLGGVRAALEMPAIDSALSALVEIAPIKSLMLSAARKKITAYMHEYSEVMAFIRATDEKMVEQAALLDSLLGQSA
jgi:hypothetical protein